MSHEFYRMKRNSAAKKLQLQLLITDQADSKSKKAIALGQSDELWGCLAVLPFFPRPQHFCFAICNWEYENLGYEMS
jgi:hypothetical protein